MNTQRAIGASKDYRGKYFWLLLLICFLFSVFPDKSFANNLRVLNSSLTGVSLASGTAQAQFDLSWENSWRVAAAPANYDAAWVFVKYSLDAGATWNHATLKTSGINPAGFSQGTGTGLDIVVPADRYGAFLQRTADGSGNVSTTGIQLVWDYAADGVSVAATARVKVFAIEMVYIPPGAFYAGSGGSETSAFYSYPTTTNAYSIASENEITVGTTAGNLYYPFSTYGGDQAGPIPAGFPKGYSAFYMMKYEISQGQYVDFLNTLTRTKQGARVETNISTDAITNVYVMSNTSTISYRNTIVCPSSGNGTTAPIIFSTTRPDRACNYLSWADAAAYSAWAALRPMTELEFEKACRGTIAPVANEYAWGSTSITQATTISGEENGTETANGNCVYDFATFSGGDAGQGSLRCGIFATASSTRQTSGAGYYGIMELSGNLWERPVTIGNATGRAFTGLNGDGVLNVSGNANVTNWPGTDGLGCGFRGGLWGGGTTNARVSDRNLAALTYSTRDYTAGGRAVRTSP